MKNEFNPFFVKFNYFCNQHSSYNGKFMQNLKPVIADKIIENELHSMTFDNDFDTAKASQRVDAIIVAVRTMCDRFLAGQQNS